MSKNFNAQLQDRLDTLRAEHKIPGATLAVLADGRIHEFASGVLNRDTGVAATPDSLFQSGSVAKIYTATVIMRLVGEGRLDLDAKVVDVLPEFGAPDPEAAARITIRQLLSHTGGVTNDFHGAADATGDDALARYVAAAREVPLDLPPGTAASYGSLGIVVLGRVIEVITGTTWNQALKDLLFDPLGLKHSVTLPQEAMRHRYAWGHLGQPGTDPEPIEMFSYIPRAFAPAAQVLVSAGDLVRLARMHLDGGAAPDGTRIVAAEAVAAMQRRESTPVDRWSVSADHWGLGWSLYDQPGFRGFGHDGSAVSQHAMLRVFPEQGVAVALMTNSGNGRALYAALFPELLAALGITMPPAFGPAVPPIEVDATRFYGVYKRAGIDITVGERDGKPHLKYDFVDVAGDIPPLEGEMKPVSDTVFSVFMTGEGINEEMPVIFSTHNDTPYCWVGMRATPKTA